jgi:hypothetical protein
MQRSGHEGHHDSACSATRSLPCLTAPAVLHTIYSAGWKAVLKRYMAAAEVSQRAS